MFKINDYIEISAVVSKVIELDNINRTINYKNLIGTSLIKQEELKEFASTNSIEGDKVSLSLAKAFLRNDEKLGRSELERRWMGIRHATSYVWSERFEFREEHIHETHRSLMREVQTAGGIYKQRINQVGSLVASHPDDVPELMKKLYFEFMETGLTEGLCIYNIVPFVSEFLAIHPYEDGNGRMSRLLMNILLFKSGYKFVKYVSVSKFLLERRKEYILALEYRNAPWAARSLKPIDLKPLFLVLLDSLINAAKMAKETSLLGEIYFETFEIAVARLTSEFSFRELRKLIVSNKSDATYKKWLRTLVDNDKLVKYGTLKSTTYKVK